MIEVWCEGRVACGHDIVTSRGFLAGRWPHAALPARPNWQTYMQIFLYVRLVYSFNMRKEDFCNLCVLCLAFGKETTGQDSVVG
jgi:hypothetical protein